MDKRIFISKNASEVQELKNHLTTQGDTLEAHSFLHFTPLDFQVTESYDVIFFGSPRAVFFFKMHYDIPQTALIACVGETTAKILHAIGRDVAFTGNGPISEVAQSFKEWSGDRTVLFPISSRSLRTISSVVDHAIEVEVYSTEVKGTPIAPCSVYVFTSPSNVQGFFLSNELPEDATCIAWGESTARALKEKGVNPSHVLKQPSIQALVDLL